MKKANNNIVINCDSCDYPLRKDCYICPNCGYKNLQTIDENGVNECITKEKKKYTSLRCFDQNMTERNIEDFLTYSKKRKYFKFDNKVDNVMVLRELKINDSLNDNDIIIENGSVIYRIRIE